MRSKEEKIEALITMTKLDIAEIKGKLQFEKQKTDKLEKELEEKREALRGYYQDLKDLAH